MIQTRKAFTAYKHLVKGWVGGACVCGGGGGGKAGD